MDVPSATEDRSDQTSVEEQPATERPEAEGDSPTQRGGTTDQDVPQEQRLLVVEGEGASTDQLRRAFADLDNLRKRFDREVGAARIAERDRAAIELNTLLDDLDRALDYVRAGADRDAVIAGLEAVRERAITVLSSLGYQRFEATGERFDPARHDAIGRAEVDSAEPGTVVSVLRPGFERDGTVVRPAAVIVAQ
jgi:molecular chaperone GrpE